MSYYLDGIEIKALNRTVLKVIEKYVTENPKVKYQELKEIFPDSLQGSIGVLKNKSDFEEYKNRTSTGERRFFQDNPIKINDDEIYICTEWGGDLKNGKEGNKNKFIDHVNKVLKYDLKEQSKVSEKIKNIAKNSGENDMANKKIQPLNQILYGPPGTGKTYHTVNKALEIIDGYVPGNREDAKKIFEEYKKAGQIEFVTFHQSYGYEEFVEGIKAKTTEKEIEYKIEAGIFKKICNKAQKKSIFRIGEKIGKYEIIGSNDDLLKLQRQNGSIIPIPMYLLKEVLELLLKKIITVDELNNKTAIDKMSRNAEKFIINGYPNVFRDLAEYYLNIKNNNMRKNKNHILIIDEINRGNISKIFGELITLIEPSKRIGAEESLHVRLPYSNELFGVPSNLYIIGTMNTADRSIALMDTALRRRFDFEEMMPNLKVLEEIDDIDGINIKSLLDTINKRIEYLYDRDHTIGHAYFMSLKDKSGDEAKDELDNIFKNKIIPLLQEYFYDDWEKILMVLGEEGFIEKIEVNSDIFTYKNEDYVEEEQSIYKIKDTFDFSEFKNDN